MFDVNHVILYVANPPASADFYAALTGRAAVEVSPTFALLILPSGLKLGLWSRDTVEPSAAAAGGGAELCFSVADEAAVRAIHDEWSGRGMTMLQQPTRMDFGFTFTATDPDGHRLRVYALDEMDAA